MSNQFLLGLDTETTDKYPDTAEIIQIGAVCHDKQLNTTSVVFNCLSYPESGKIAAEASEIHGHYIDELRAYPEASMVAWLFEQLICSLNDEGEVVLVTYNGEAYDLPILRRYGATKDNHLHIDMYRVIQRWPQMWGENLKMGTVYANCFGKPMGNAHDAVADVIALLEILQKFMADTNMTVEDVIEWMNKPMVLQVCHFGKFMGTPFHKVPKAYLRWVRDNWDNINPDVELTLRKYL